MAKMSANVSKLTPKQEQAVLALLTNQGVDNAARAVGIAPRTLYRWMNEPLFDKAFRKARRDAFGQGTARLQQASGAAVSSILKIMLDQHAAANGRRDEPPLIPLSQKVHLLGHDSTAEGDILGQRPRRPARGRPKAVFLLLACCTQEEDAGPARRVLATGETRQRRPGCCPWGVKSGAGRPGLSVCFFGPARWLTARKRS